MHSNRIVDNSTLLVVQVEPPQQEDGGDYYYRTYAPGLAMAREKGIYVINLTNVHRHKEDIMRKADVLILKNICDADILPLIKERKQQKRLTVYELADDICEVPSWNPVHFFYKDQENLLLFKKLASYCDTMQFSVPELQRLYSYLTHCSAVFSNQITDVPSERNYKNYKKIVIGWGGSHGHLEDMAQFAEPLIDWIISRDNIKLFLMCSDPIWSLFENLPKVRKQRFKTGSLSDYYTFLKQIDIGLAPLKNTGFNRSRSDVKFLEYAVFGVVPVVQVAVPYVSTVKNGETGFLFEDTAGMLDILDVLVDDIACIPQVARAAREYVIKERLQQAHSQERTVFYRTQLSMLNNGNVEKADAGSIFESFADIKGAVRDGRYLRLLSTRFENLLHDGLVLSQVEGEKVLAWSAFSEASRAEPGNYLPYLFGASCSKDMAGCLAQAVEINPHSLKSWILMGEEYARQGDILKSIKCFESAAKIFPEYEIPYLRAAALLQKLGHKEESADLNEKAQGLILPLKAQA